MDRNVSNDMTGTSIPLPLATIEEDINEIDNNDDDKSLKCNIKTKIIDKNGKRILLRKNISLDFIMYFDLRKNLYGNLLSFLIIR